MGGGGGSPLRRAPSGCSRWPGPAASPGSATSSGSGRTAGKTSPVGLDPLEVAVDGVEEVVHSPVGFGDLFGQVDCERCDCAARPCRGGPAAVRRARAAYRRSRSRSRTCGSWRPTSWREFSRRAASRSGTSSIVRARRPVASSHQKTVPASVASRHPGVPTDGKDHLAPCADEFVGDLYAGGGRANHKHAPRRRARPGCDRRPRSPARCGGRGQTGRPARGAWRADLWRRQRDGRTRYPRR